MLFFTSDTHLDHFNIIRYCNRPFKTTEEMNETIISNWNSVVKPEDTVYHLGDFCLSARERMRWLGSRLNGHKHLIMGNHDKGKTRLHEAGFESVIRSIHETFKLKNGMTVHLAHYPYKTNDAWNWSPVDNGLILLCGHVHDRWKIKNKMVNVGVDVHNFTPISEEQILQLIKENQLE
jgi:calcineurin-like phosphoesterase family protein